MLLAFLASPILGSLSDRYDLKRPLLLFFSVLATVGLFFLGRVGYYQALTLFVISLSSVHIANVFYNGLLADISDETDVGRIGGVGVGIGYLGSILAILLSLLFMDSRGFTFLFQLTALIMIVFYSPLVFWGRGPSLSRAKASFYGMLTDVFKNMRLSLSESIKELKWRRFLMARFWYLWAINGASFFAVLYGAETIKISDYQMQLILITGIMFAIPSGIFWGWLILSIHYLF